MCTCVCVYIGIFGAYVFVGVFVSITDWIPVRDLFD